LTPWTTCRPTCGTPTKSWRSSSPTCGLRVRPTLPESRAVVLDTDVASLIIKGRARSLAPRLAGSIWCASFVTIGELVNGRRHSAGACASGRPCRTGSAGLRCSRTRSMSPTPGAGRRRSARGDTSTGERHVGRGLLHRRGSAPRDAEREGLQRLRGAPRTAPGARLGEPGRCRRTVAATTNLRRCFESDFVPRPGACADSFHASSTATRSGTGSTRELLRCTRRLPGHRRPHRRQSRRWPPACRPVVDGNRLPRRQAAPRRPRPAVLDTAGPGAKCCSRARVPSSPRDGRLRPLLLDDAEAPRAEAATGSQNRTPPRRFRSPRTAAAPPGDSPPGYEQCRTRSRAYRSE
jgi:hypothetical protein